jgi:hypothetical protein
MNTLTGAVLGIAVLSASGALPAVALSRARLVTIPLAPLTGAAIAGLAVTAMTGLGGSVADWFVFLSLVGAAVSILWWWEHPPTRPWSEEQGRVRERLVCGTGLVVGAIAAAFGLSALKAPIVSYDARTTWMVHPAWYLAGHNTTVAALRNPALTFSHAPYPPLIGGAVAMSWFVSGLHTARLGVVIVALLSALAALAAASVSVELTRRLAVFTESRNRRAVMLGAGVVTMGLLVSVAFAVARANMVDGYADSLWACAAVGAIAFGLVLPLEAPSVGAAAVLAAVAGTTKMEGSLTAAVIVGLIAVRLLIHQRRTTTRAWMPVCVFALGTWFVIGIWPLVIRLLGALPDRAEGGPRRGTDATRLHASVLSAWSELHIVAVAVAISLIGSLVLRARRRRSALGSDAWAWIAVGAEVAIVVFAYMVGPGNVHDWLHASIRRTMMFAVLGSYWIMANWAMIAVGEMCLVSPTEPLRELSLPEPVSA